MQCFSPFSTVVRLARRRYVIILSRCITLANLYSCDLKWSDISSHLAGVFYLNPIPCLLLNITLPSTFISRNEYFIKIVPEIAVSCVRPWLRRYIEYVECNVQDSREANVISQELTSAIMRVVLNYAVQGDNSLTINNVRQSSKKAF